MKINDLYFKDYLNKYDDVVVGVSGGVDSVLLLHYLVSNFNNNFIVAHVNHGLREESIVEYNFVENLCERYGVVFKGCHLDVKSYMDMNNVSSVETAARDLRYDFYRSVLKDSGSEVLFLGHHGDDLVEGILMRLVGGASGKGLICMSQVNRVDEDLLVLRPFLELSKEDIYNFASFYNLDWFEDASNKDNIYTRNRYRNNILPFLKEENKNTHLNFLDFSNFKKEEESYFDNIVNEKENELYSDNGIYKVDKSFWYNEDIVIRRRLLIKVLKNLGMAYVSKNSLSVLEEKLKNNFNTDYNKLYDGIYIVNSRDYFYILNRDKKFLLNSSEGKVMVDNDLYFGGKKVKKILVDCRVPSAFRKFIYKEDLIIKDVLGNVLMELN